MTDKKHPLYFLGPQWFAPVMGWCGLALAWYRAQEGFGAGAALICAACGAVAALIFVTVLAAAMLRYVRHPGALAEDLAHPVRQGFAAAFPVSIILLATVGVALGLPDRLNEIVWAIGLAVQLGVTTWIISRWLAGKLRWASMTPVVYIPIVGNILVPLAGVPLHHEAVSWAFFGIGAFFWPVVTALVLARQVHQPMPDRLAPAWFITIAPPSVAGLSALTLGAPFAVAYAALGAGGVMLLAVATRVPAIVKAPFAMPSWAASFPLAAFSALLFRATADAPGLRLPSILMLVVTSLVVLGLTLATIRGLRAGTLLAPEPVAVLSVEPAAAAAAVPAGPLA
ncbi:MAG TPA: SLAC1 anion channel family protein [Burkholderiaceae bacterium]|jgi:tellurite resistance protein|nr:SLAC1 anion channel family protein [Burkholderiaceae bacterium]